MTIYTTFPAGWWLLTAVFYLPYLFLVITRKSYKKKTEFKTQFIFGLAALILSFIVENIGIRTQLWTYYPGNWPLILWFNYFGSGLLGYQILKKIEERS
jgi:hypothetical protein